MTGGPGYTSTSPLEPASRTEPKTSVHPRQPLSMYGSSCKSGSRTLDSTSTPVEILESGRNHTADTIALYLQSTSHGVVVFISLTVSPCRYFLDQNAAIQKGTIKGEIINLKVLGIGNGLTVWRSGMPRLLTCC